MKLFKIGLAGLLFLLISVSCNKTGTATVSFGANYNVINCITTVTVFVDGGNMGKLENPSSGVNSCDQPETLNLRLPVGMHHYHVEIRELEGIGCTKDIDGDFKLNENDCVRIFIDYTKIDWNN